MTFIASHQSGVANDVYECDGSQPSADPDFHGFFFMRRQYVGRGIRLGFRRKWHNCPRVLSLRFRGLITQANSLPAFLHPCNTSCLTFSRPAAGCATRLVVAILSCPIQKYLIVGALGQFDVF